MRKNLTKFLLLVIAFTFALSINYIFAAWTGPIQAPPGGNTPTPVHIGTTNQVKDGGLGLNALSVFGNGYFQDNVGIGTVSPQAKLDVAGNVNVAGKIKVGDDSVSPTAGTIRWTGSDFEGYDGTQWVSFTLGSGGSPNLEPDCVIAGGNWEDSHGVCYFQDTSCPSGWLQEANYSSTKEKTCSRWAQQCWKNISCTTGSHYQESKPVESCIYSCIWAYTCYASQTEVGCVKTE